MRAALVIAALGVAAVRPAHAEPSDERLLLVGAALAPPTYLIGVSLHEGSHALMAELLGADVTGMRLFPPGIDPKVNAFRFGWVYAQGLRTRTDKQLFYLAPKFTNVLLLGGFAAVLFTDAWPENKYGQLALTVGATGMWVDFSKDLFAFSRNNDVVKVFRGWCMTGWRQVPARLVYASAVAGLGYVVARGYQKTFDEQEPAMVTRTFSLPIIADTF